MDWTVNSSTKRKKEEEEFVQLRHFVFLGGTGALTEEDIKLFFSDDGILSVQCIKKDQSAWSIASFQSSSLVEELCDKHFIFIDSKRVEVKTFNAKRSVGFGRKMIEEDENLSRMEKDMSTTALKTTKIVEKGREQLPLTFTPGETFKWHILVRNEGALDITLVRVKKVVEDKRFWIENVLKPVRLQCGQEKKLIIQFTSKELQHGTFRQMMLFEFENAQQSFVVDVKVGNEDDLKALAPVEDYEPYEPDMVERKIIPAFPPTRPTSSHFHTNSHTEWVNKLPDYPIPPEIQKDIDQYSYLKDWNSWLLESNYKQRLHHLLYIEEAQQRKDIRKYDLLNVTFEKLDFIQKGGRIVTSDDREPFHRLEVPGLAEKRPSVLYSDSIYAWIPGTKDVEYEGWVYQVEQKSVTLQFCPGFHKMFPPGTAFNVRFMFNRIPMRMMHRALDVVKLDLVWPHRTEENKSVVLSDMETTSLFDKDLNEEQRQAVANIVYKTHGSIPFLLFGAFGTGKSKTVTETVKQILRVHENARVLICAPSNSAADFLASNLVHFLNPKKMLRLYAFNRNRFTVPDELFPYTSFSDERKIFDIPSVKDLASFKVVVSTCFTSGNLYGVGVGPSHFTHIIIDEAAQVMEPEALLPLSLAGPGTSVVMSGDDKQSFTPIQSESAKFHKMDKSLMERISNIYDVYRDRADPTVCIELIKNYRCHPKILHFLSERFYKGKLDSKAPPQSVNALSDWSALPNQKFPFLFYGIEGEDLREESSPSFFNRIEASVLVSQVKHLMQSKKLNPADIGIISPYYKQVQKIRQLLSTYKIRDIKVGTPDEFQGTERKAIFISTVRSSRSWLSHDRKHNLGFLGNEKRINTALSRAIALVVIVGDPYILHRDETWRSLIQYCKENNAYRGPGVTKEYELEREKNDPEPEEEEDHDQEGRMEELENHQLLPSPRGAPGSGVPVAKPATPSPIAPTPTSPTPSTAPLNPNQNAALPAKYSPLGPPPRAGGDLMGAWAPPQQQQQQQYQNFSPFDPQGAPPIPQMYDFGYFLFSNQFGGSGGPGPNHYPNALGNQHYQSLLPSGVEQEAELPTFQTPAQLLPDADIDTDGSFETPWTCIYSIDERPLIYYKTIHGCPPIRVIEKEGIVTIKISIFGLKAFEKLQQSRIFIELSEMLEEGTKFSLINLHSPGMDTQKKSELMITFPEDLFDMRLLDTGKSKMAFVLSVPRRNSNGVKPNGLQAK